MAARRHPAAPAPAAPGGLDVGPDHGALDGTLARQGDEVLVGGPGLHEPGDRPGQGRAQPRGDQQRHHRIDPLAQPVAVVRAADVQAVAAQALDVAVHRRPGGAERVGEGLPRHPGVAGLDEGGEDPLAALGRLGAHLRRHRPSRILRTSSSRPGSRMASTWSPAARTVAPTAISAVPSRTTEIRREPVGRPRSVDRLADARALRVDLDLDDLEVLLAQLQQVHQVVLGHLVLDQGHDPLRRAHRRRDAEQVEVRLVARVVDARDHLLHAVPLARELGDDEVVLVVAGHRHHDVRRPRDRPPAPARRARCRRRG